MDMDSQSMQMSGQDMSMSDPDMMGMSSSKSSMMMAVFAHGLIMAICFVALFPLGAMIMHLPNFRGRVWVHAAFQSFFYLGVLAAMGLGIWFTTKEMMWKADNGHPIIGLVVVGGLLFQPSTGLLQHFQGRTDAPGEAHKWFGRAMIILGVINGGLGMKLSGIKMDRLIPYVVLTVFFYILWVVVIFATAKLPGRHGKPDVEAGSVERKRFGSNRNDPSDQSFFSPTPEKTSHDVPTNQNQGLRV